MLTTKQTYLLRESYLNPFHKIDLRMDRVSYKVPNCSDILQLEYEFSPEGKLSVYFAAEGCQLSLSSASLMCQSVEGLNREESLTLINRVNHCLRTGSLLLEIKDLSFLAAFHKKPNRKHCVALCWESLKKELLNF